MAPHHALTIAEIISIILSNLQPIDRQDSRGRQDVLSAVLSCKTFMGHGLNVLWHTMYDIGPLLRLIPGMRVIDERMVLLGELNLEGLAGTNFYTYAKRIKHCRPSDIFSIEPSTCVQLLQLEDGLLPSLTTLEISGDDDFAYSRNLLPLLLPSFLRSGSVSTVYCHFGPCHVPDDDYDVKQLDGVILALVKNANVKALRHLRLGGVLYPEYASLLSRLNHLQSVSLHLSQDSWTFEAFDVLSRLRLVHVDLDFGPAYTVPLRNVAYGAFPMITSLSLSGRKSLMHYMLSCIAGDNLRWIRICDKNAQANYENAVEHARIYQHLGRFSSLCLITFHALGWEGLPPTPQPIIPRPESAIHSLVGLKHLETLSLMFFMPWFCVTDAEISATAARWPRMKRLSLIAIPSIFATDIQYPTLISLHSLALNCPTLVELVIQIDMQASISLSDLTPISSHGHCPLQLLDLRSTVFNHPLYMAQVLEYLFPRLNTVSFCGRRSEALENDLRLIKHERLVGGQYALPRPP